VIVNKLEFHQRLPWKSNQGARDGSRMRYMWERGNMCSGRMRCKMGTKEIW
jgi:hypothetical protein